MKTWRNESLKKNTSIYKIETENWNKKFDSIVTKPSPLNVKNYLFLFLLQ